MTDNTLTAGQAIQNFQKALGYTNEAIIKALECCRGFGECEECALCGESSCNDKLIQLAADRIRALSVGFEKTVIKTVEILLGAEKILTGGDIFPCKVGDEVWAIRTFGNGKKVPQKGKVSEMYYIDESMRLCIVVKGITRGRWGEKVFPTFEDADRYLQANKIEDV